ncbi:dTDP-4-dehydrorhamnose reductase [Rubellimicrobium mesophilum DSM 19309]|uniref:dTDP-4-dehydrorhamnose reductase n=1 Tax=Rubellimicrobium mesophilum DSM 19309 TaxID=442562 RepID=A0A017HWW5_9RHOB|nr:beta-galactosidase [Rubellimicrobium mesophilum]EYD78244.1 dTDP-4-dehydrorhamnose reductase [Rubellimicrobium mesophilum DSM 19309]
MTRHLSRQIIADVLASEPRERPQTAVPRLTYLTGFEGTQMFGHATDVLDTTEHTVRYKEDLKLLVADGIDTFRACIPWHKIERVRGVYDWAWTDRYLGYVRRLGLRPIADPLHHTSFPQWLEHGFANPEFPQAYRDFVRAFARRYPWVTDYTVINEPLATAVLAGFMGEWYPHWRDRAGIVPIILGKARAICLVTPMLERMVPNLRIVHVDTCERHQALDPQSQYHTDFGNDLRFVVLDLILGRVDERHPLWGTLVEHGLSVEEAAWFRDNPARIDVLGLDYYAHSELGWNVHGQSDEFRPVGFRQVALDYVERYPFPVMLTETNVRGRIEDRMSWLKYMVQECEALVPELERRGLPFEGFCWYPYLDSTDWCSLCRQPDRAIDPQGIYYLDGTFNRRGSELSLLYARLARGEIGSAELPAYRFEEPVLDGRGVRKFLPLMEGWDWREGQPSVE